ncbi:MAG: hypothetical protein L6420_04450, partial [Elusimicrobia bacterium]|nr:hypothetical protein [Elusimicrobiota bacterium]
AGSSQTANIFATVEGLYPPTTFFFRIKAMNSIGVWNNYAIIGSKANGSSAPGNPIISAVYQSSITVSYGAVADVDGYVIEASTKSDFSVILYSSSTGNNLLETLIVQDMELNATYYMRAGSLIGQATDYANTDPPTATLPIETPTDIVFEEITFSTITASAYAATPGFSNLHSGESATNIAIEEAYAGWHTGGNAWLTKAVIPTARIYLAAAAVGGKIYAIGGHTASNKNEEYDPAANEWMTKADLPTVRYHLAVAAVGGKIYAIGGYNGTQKENEEYDPIADTWDTKAVMPTARYRLSAAAVGGKIYAIGGWGGTNINEEYDPATDTWATKADMPTAREYLAAAAVGGKVYVIGGGGGTNKNEEYDPANGANGTWTTKTDMPTGRYNLAGAAVGGKIYAIGGYGGTQKENEEYDPLTNTWKIKAVMPTARSGLAAVAVGGKIYAVGGTNKNEEYDPGVTQKFTPLAPNTEYSFKAKARNVAGTETAESVTVSTYTLVYSSGPASFPAIYPSSITVAWSTGTPLIGYNGPGATYLVQTSPYSDFSAVANSSQTLNIYATMSGSMNPNTLYYFRVKAANALNIWNDYTVIGSTYTATVKPGKPVLSTDTFKGVYFSSITIAWLANGNPDYTEYRVQASTTEADYTGALYGPYVGPSGWLTVNAPDISTAVVSLTGCVTYYFRVQARSLSFEETEFEELGSTRTAMYFECGLRMYDGTQVVRLICGCQPKYCDPPASPLRIGKDGIVYTLPLVDPVAANASKLRVRDPDGNTKALRKN